MNLSRKSKWNNIQICWCSTQNYLDSCMNFVGKLWWNGLREMSVWLIVYKGRFIVSSPYRNVSNILLSIKGSIKIGHNTWEYNDYVRWMISYIHIQLLLLWQSLDNSTYIELWHISKYKIVLLFVCWMKGGCKNTQPLNNAIKYLLWSQNYVHNMVECEYWFSSAYSIYTHFAVAKGLDWTKKKFIVLLGALANCKSIVNELDHRPIIISQGIFYVLKFWNVTENKERPPQNGHSIQLYMAVAFSYAWWVSEWSI